MSLGIFGRGRLAMAVRETASRETTDHDTTSPDTAGRGPRRKTVAWLVGRSEEPTVKVDVAIDCSIADAVEAHVDWALATGTDLVIAATGWHIDDLAARIDTRIGVVVAPNGSLTVAIMARLARIFAAYGRAQYGGNAGGYLLDHHHAAKVDAPSGTALRLAAAWRDTAGDTADDAVPLAVSSLRAGHAVGTHVLGLDAPGEQLELTHRARSRTPFAHGLLRAATWIRGRRGLFTMDDVARATLDPIFGDT